MAATEVKDVLAATNKTNVMADDDGGRYYGIRKNSIICEWFTVR
jgi:hypothetical protein